MAIFNATTGCLAEVKGLPEESTISAIGEMPYTHNGLVYMPITTTADGSYPAFYRIDPKTATATKGATVEAESVTIAGWLDRQ